MRKKIIGIFICTLLIVTVLSTAKPETTIRQQQSSTNGIIFSQVDFLFIDGMQNDSHWGHIEVDIVTFMEQYTYDKGYLNMYTDAGWVVQNQFIDKVEGMDYISMYFNLGITPGVNVEVLSLYLEFTPEPFQYFQDGPRIEYTVGAIGYNAGGFGEEPPWVPGVLEIIDFFAGATYDYTKPNLNENENVQTAYNQCGPMGIANSLQYLENRNAHFSVPHDHVLGLRGDDSLVGQLDTAMNRNAPNRRVGSGVSGEQLFEGKFQYLADNGLADSLIHRHQTNGDFDTPVGDFTHAGITTRDQSVDGRPTFEWIEEQLRNCEDVEVGIRWGLGGGHIVRVYGCGRTLGVPFLRYKHDRLQTNRDFADNAGLEEVQVFVTDLDGDGLMNWGAAGDEIVLAISESVIPLFIHYDPDLMGIGYVGATIRNVGEFDLPSIVWFVDLEGLVILGSHTEGAITLQAGGEKNISSNLIIGFGFAEIIITAKTTDEMYEVVKKARCFLFGPFIINLGEV